VQVRLLGQVDVVVGGAARTVSGLRRKAVLATLALSVGEIVSTDRLADAVWGDGTPPTALNTLQRHVSYLRTVLGSKVAIFAKPPGYVLDLGDEGTDVRLAERLLRQADLLADPARAAADLRQALALWRGTPLADVTGIAWFEQQAERLSLLRGQIERALVQARLASGEHAQLVPELERMVADQPLDEGLHAQLMLALYHCGRQADALAAYQRLRTTLGEQLGIDPNQALQELEMAILRQDASLSLDTPAGTVTLPKAATCPPMPVPVPAQLPPAVAGFAGRDAELASLDAFLARSAADGSQSPRTVVIAAITGTAGVGKTTLALHWAHRVRDHFPDGQLYVNLRGFDPSEPAMGPDLALRGFLEALGVPPERVPGGVEAKAGLYRSLLSGKRVLVVLDNARDTEQVRPLLPGAAGCLALVTSRNQLTGLIAAEGAHPLQLDLLTVPEARVLLARRLEARRVTEERQAAEEIIASCARLPLALAIVAARAAARPGFPLARIAAELRQATALLDPFDDGELAVNVRTVFACSYHALSSGAARLFRLLGLHPGPDISVSAAASLAGVARDQATTLLAELARAHMLTEQFPGRYTFHDLLRAYAAEQARACDDEEARHAGIGRILDYYLHTADAAALHLNPRRDGVTTAPPQSGVTREEIADYQQALAWFTAEHPVLLAAIARTPAGFGAYTWRLASALTTFLDRRGYWQELKAAQSTALAAARRQGDQVGQATACRGLGLAYRGLKQFDDARTHYLLALDLFRELGHHTGLAQTHVNLAWLAGAQGRHGEALEHSRQSLRQYQAADSREGQAIALNNVGWHFAELGDYDQALVYCQKALILVRELGDLSTQAHTWDSLGYIYLHLDRHAQAVGCYQHAILLFSATGDLYGEATSLSRLGDVHDAVGTGGAARRAWMRALDIFGRLDHPDANKVRAKLRSQSLDACRRHSSVE
jgi:DNA-binding SARP family transcriptional activator/Tfp pilus assembly protein PilF